MTVDYIKQLEQKIAMLEEELILYKNKYREEVDNNEYKEKYREDDVDPEALTVENAYKTRWIWYHTILAIGIFLTNVLLVAILTILAIKL